MILKQDKKKVYASGLRNPNGLAWQPETGQLWTVVNERDELGNDLVPDYLTSVNDGDFLDGLMSIIKIIKIPELKKKCRKT